MANQSRRLSRLAIRRTFTLLSLSLLTVAVVATFNSNDVGIADRYRCTGEDRSYRSNAQKKTTDLSVGTKTSQNRLVRPCFHSQFKTLPTAKYAFVRGGSTTPKRKNTEPTSTSHDKKEGPTRSSKNDKSTIAAASPSTQPSFSSSSTESWSQRDMLIFYTSSFLTIVASSFVAFSPAPFLIDAIGSERATSTLSMLGSTAALTEIIISPALGSLLDSIGRKPAFICAVSIMALIHGIVAFNPSVIAICASKFVKTLSIGLFVITTQVIISDVSGSNPKHMSSVLGIYFALSACGFFVGAIVAGKLSEYGLSITYGSSMVLSALTALLVSFGMQESLNPAKRIPFKENKPLIQKQLLRSPLSSCTSILFRHSKEVRILAILIMIQSLPNHMHDTFQILVRSEWGVGMKEFSSFIAIYGIINIFSNIVGGQLIIKLGIKYFTGIATLSSALAPLAASLFSFRGLLIGCFAGFLAPAQMLGVTSALYAEGAKSNVPQGELAGERSSFLALAKVICPIWYSFLYVQGKKAMGTGLLPFLFNVLCGLSAFVISQRYLPS